MSDTKWTTGPWHVSDDDRNGQAVVSNDHIEIATCWHHCVGAIEKEMRHNAWLIAAAPDLYEALQACAAVCAGEVVNKSGLINALTKAREALCKARGKHE